jgi:hypothetical protein
VVVDEPRAGVGPALVHEPRLGGDARLAPLGEDVRLVAHGAQVRADGERLIADGVAEDEIREQLVNRSEAMSA